MRLFTIGLIAGLVLATTGVAGAATARLLRARDGDTIRVNASVVCVVKRGAISCSQAGARYGVILDTKGGVASVLRDGRSYVTCFQSDQIPCVNPG